MNDASAPTFDVRLGTFITANIRFIIIIRLKMKSNSFLRLFLTHCITQNELKSHEIHRNVFNVATDNFVAVWSKESIVE